MLQRHIPSDTTLLRDIKEGAMLQRHIPSDAALLRGTQRGAMLKRHTQSGAMIWGHKSMWKMTEVLVTCYCKQF